MKKFILLLFFGFLQFFTPLLAQQYKPFAVGRTCYFAAADSLYLLKVDWLSVTGTDSVFTFNKIAKPGTFKSTSSCSAFAATHTITTNNLLGSNMIVQPYGNYLFTTAADTFLLKTRVPAGQTWVFNQGTPSLTAQITNRSLETFLNTTDSVITISVSNGKTLQLSKNYGLLQTFAFTDSAIHPSDFVLFALPEKGLGKQINTLASYYDYQPGDEFRHYQVSYTNHTFGTTICSETWINTKVTDRYQSPLSDTIKYTLETQTLYQSYGSPDAPSGFCQNPSDTILSPVETQMLLLVADKLPQLALLSNQFLINEPQQTATVNAGTYKSPINNRFSTEYGTVLYDSCSQLFGKTPDYNEIKRYSAGLGLTYEETGNWSSGVIKELQYYKKGAEVYGQRMELTKTQELAGITKPNEKETTKPTENTLNKLNGGKTEIMISNLVEQNVNEQLETTTTYQTSADQTSLAGKQSLLQGTTNITQQQK